MAISDFIPENFNVSDDDILAAKDQDQVQRLAVKLFTRLVLVVDQIRFLHCHSNDGMPREFVRDDAIIAALLFRLDKHLAKFHQQLLQDDLEVASIVARTAIDTGITLCYLLVENDPDNFRKYLHHSLRRRKSKLDSLREELANGATPLPNARVVVRDIQHSFDEAGVKEQDITPRSVKEWDKDGGIRRRAQKLDWDDIYRRMFTLTSDAVHGSWDDLRAFHLESQGGGYFKVKEEPPRWTYEILIAMSDFVAKAAGILVSLLPEDHPEHVGLTEEINATLGRVVGLYLSEQAGVAEHVAEAYKEADWQFADVGEPTTETCPPIAVLGVEGGVLIIVNRSQCHLNMKLTGGRIEHHTIVEDTLIEVDRMWFGFDTLSLGTTSVRVEQHTVFLTTCTEMVRQRMGRQFDREFRVESVSIADLPDRVCVLCQVPSLDCEALDGQVVKRRLYLRAFI
ncbi:MAG: hypothetical protein JST22_18975 [Bacteroidetes bacterium]|nr:hypothetical protein [Bacteroidota bacterium]